MFVKHFLEKENPSGLTQLLMTSIQSGETSDGRSERRNLTCVSGKHISTVCTRKLLFISSIKHAACCQARVRARQQGFQACVKNIFSRLCLVPPRCLVLGVTRKWASYEDRRNYRTIATAATHIQQQHNSHRHRRALGLFRPLRGVRTLKYVYLASIHSKYLL